MFAFSSSVTSGFFAFFLAAGGTGAGASATGGGVGAATVFASGTTLSDRF